MDSLDAVIIEAGLAPIAVSLPFSPQSAAEARHRINEWLANFADGQDLRDDAQLIVSELVSNAVRHARPLADGTMHLDLHCLPDGVDIAVSDGGSEEIPHRVEAGSTDVSGRGLAIVGTLATHWWIDTLPHQRTVHATLQLR